MLYKLVNHCIANVFNGPAGSGCKVWQKQQKVNIRISQEGSGQFNSRPFKLILLLYIVVMLINLENYWTIEVW